MMKTPDLPEEKPSASDKRDSITAASLMARIRAGEIITATDCPKADRPLFWPAIARVRDELPTVKPTWRTIAEQHLDGVRTRQKMFRIFPRQRGVIDSTLAGLIALAAVCAVLLAGGLPI